MDKEFEKFLSGFEEVLVIWEDSTAVSEWGESSMMKELKPSICVTKGFLVDKDDDKIIISSTLSPPNEHGDCTEVSFSCTIVIPVGCIKEIR